MKPEVQHRAIDNSLTCTPVLSDLAPLFGNFTWGVDPKASSLNDITSVVTPS